jgi:dienelactone hydrolase
MIADDIIETDAAFNLQTRYQTEERLVKKNATYQINVYSGTQHGFAIRVDLSNRKQVFGKESAFFQAVRWFDEWLKGSSTTAARQAYIIGE